MNKITLSKTLAKIARDEGWRIFALAILASLLWHLFWLSTICIVSSPANPRAVKFSKVSFLGPLLGKGGMELQARPKERSFLEMRYLGEARHLAQMPAQSISMTADKYEDSNDAYYRRDEQMTALIDDALSGEKLEPSHEEE